MRLPMPGATGILGLVLALGPGPQEAAKDPAPQKSPTPPATSPDPRVEEAISRYMAVSQPGPEHRWLDPLEGSWNVTVSWQGGGTRTLTGTSENHWILGGRFLRCQAVIGEEPSRIDDETIYGYDNRQQRFFAVRLNNLATYYLQPWGAYNPPTRSFIFSGKERDEATGAVLVYRELLKVDSPDRHVLTVFFDLPRGPLKVVEATYLRR